MMCRKIALLLLVFLVLNEQSWCQVTEDVSQKAAYTIGKWLSKATGHYDLQSATTVNPQLAGKKFFGIPDMQMASDYGFSYSQAPRTNEVTQAYKTLEADTSSMASSLKLSRFHLNLGFANKHDFTFSYLLPSAEEIQGWGIGYKRVIVRMQYYYMSYRFGYSRSSRDEYFSATSYVNDISASLYLRLIDLYAGIRHWSGKVRFESSMPELQLDTIDYFSTASELEPYVGIIAATTTNTRLAVEASSLSESYSVAGKFSFHFDSLLPSFNNWFRDPRYIKQ
ncbi:MAG: hypothetical protein H0V66_02785 [Bdellovibrionales bacterium]|nr:hypothetical protein [Bdellovibrionales bacterium]